MNDITWFSQAGQDKWVCETLNYIRGGLFVDIGAFDGIQTSNTYTLETYLRWEGLCVEPNPYAYGALKVNRKCDIIDCAVMDYNGYCSFSHDKVLGDSGNTPCRTLNSLFEEFDLGPVVDYMSLDIEGMEYTALKNFDFTKYTVKLMTVEHNLYCDGPEKKDKLYKLLSENGYIRVVDNAPCLDRNPAYYLKPYEDWYVHNNYKHLIHDNN